VCATRISRCAQLPAGGSRRYESESGTRLADFQSAQWLQQRRPRIAVRSSLYSPSPLSLNGRSQEAFWQPTLTDLRERGKTVVLGVCTPHTGEPGYVNRALDRRRGSRELHPESPGPLGMVEAPSVGGRAAQSRLLPPPCEFGPPGGRLICDEQLLPWPVLSSLVARRRYCWEWPTTAGPLHTNPALPGCHPWTWSRLFACLRSPPPTTILNRD